MADLDFGDLAPDTAPDRNAVKRAIASAEQVSVAGPVSALGAVLVALHRRDRLDIGVAWTPSSDPLAAGLSRTWGVDPAGQLTGERSRTLGLVRDDQGGVLLARGRVTSSPTKTGARDAGSRFGAQIYHDSQRVADGVIKRVDVRPDWSSVDTLTVNVHKQLWRRGDISHGRAIQVACDPAVIEIDGVRFPRPMTKWTWYADPRLRWTLIST
ncbi:MAG: hypothetical protein H0T99_08230 [Geodermatophilaceae bacterium]|nr:hypothetical protein [Geodermatophilaceae bacterium]